MKHRNKYEQFSKEAKKQFQLERTCLRKKKFESAEQAQEKGSDVYRCLFCEFSDLTSQIESYRAPKDIWGYYLHTTGSQTLQFYDFEISIEVDDIDVFAVVSGIRDWTPEELEEKKRLQTVADTKKEAEEKALLLRLQTKYGTNISKENDKNDREVN